MGNMDYIENMENLLKANGSSVVHARTQQTIIGTSGLDSKVTRVKAGMNHLCRIPRIAYHRKKNQTLRNGYRTIIVDGQIMYQKYNSIMEEWTEIRAKDLRFQATAQYKTVWFSKHGRRM